MTNTNTLSPLAVTRAFSLARAHGHSWACDPALPYLTEDGDLRPGVTWSEIDAGWAAALPSMKWPGISPPVRDEFGATSHSTGTGRLQWEVRADGTTVLTVNRPSGSVLRAVVGTDSGTDSVMVEVLDPELTLARHWVALTHAIKNLGVDHAEIGRACSAASEAAQVTEIRLATTTRRIVVGETWSESLASEIASTIEWRLAGSAGYNPEWLASEIERLRAYGRGLGVL